MEAKVSKAQQEVWEWKEKAYEQIKNLTKQQRLDFILSQTKEMVEAIKAVEQKITDSIKLIGKA